MTLPAGNRIWGNNKGRTNANRDTLLSVPSLDLSSLNTSYRL